jgi:hypothetical protein
VLNKNENKTDNLKQNFDLKSFFSKSYVLIAALALIVIIVFTPFLFSGKMLFGSDTMAGIDSRIFLKNSLAKYHQFPLWFDSRLGGMPSCDAMFGDAMYPPTLAMNAMMPISRALGMRLVLHVFLAGLFFFLLLRKGFKTPAFVAFIGGALYMLNPEFFSHIYPGHDGKMFVIAWLPFVVWRMKSLMEKPNLLNSTLLALGIAICLFTSHIQMSYFTLWGLFLYWFMFSIVTWIREKRPLPVVKVTGFFCLAVVLGIGLSLIQLLPPFMYVRDALSVRGVGRGFEYAASWSLHWPEAFSLWVPEFGGFNVEKIQTYWSENPFKLNTEYAGAIALLFSVFAIILKRKPWRIFWGGVAVLAFIYALGAHTPLFYIAYNLIPGVKKFRACSMLMFWFSFSTILLAALFFKDIANDIFTTFSAERRKKWIKGIWIAIGVITVVTLLFSIKGFVIGIMQPLCVSLGETQKMRIFDDNFSKNFVPSLWIWWVFAAGLMALLTGVISGKIGRNAFLCAVMAIGLIDVLRVDSYFIKTVDPRPYFYDEQGIADLQTEMAIEPFRCFALPGTFGEQNAEGIHGLEGVGGFHDNELRWYRDFRGDQQDRNYYTNLLGFQSDGRPYLKPENLKSGNAFLNLANVRYYLFRQGQSLIKISNEGALGRLSFASGYLVLDSNQIVQNFIEQKIDYRKVVCLLEEPKQKPAASPVDTIVRPITVIWKAYTPNFRKAVVAVPGDGFLRISEVYYPGWEVHIDRQPARIYRADLAWMAVNITKGEHTVEMMPHSLYLKKAEIVSYPLMALLFLYWFVIGAKKMSKSRKHLNK